MTEPTNYAQKKAFLNRVITVYGRKPVLESLLDDTLQVHALHLAQSNKPAPILSDILASAQLRDIPVNYHDRSALARISKNGKQDQGVALDVLCPAFTALEDFLAEEALQGLLGI